MPKRTGASLHGKTVRVMGRKQRIELREQTDLGLCHHHLNLITLRKDAGDQIPTLLHECLERAMDLLGHEFSDESEEHKLLTAMESAAVQIIRDNPEIFSGLFDE